MAAHKPAEWVQAVINRFDEQVRSVTAPAGRAALWLKPAVMHAERHCRIMCEALRGGFALKRSDLIARPVGDARGRSGAQPASESSRDRQDLGRQAGRQAGGWVGERVYTAQPGFGQH
ncbi:hypothetical protein MHYP_G00184830 [Metynnis hypsauchen]